MLVNSEREAGKFSTCWLSAERTSLAVEAGSSSQLLGNWRKEGPVSLSSCLGRTSSGHPESEERCSGMPRLLHKVLGCCRPCATCTATNMRPLPSYCRARRWRSRELSPLRCHPRGGKRGVGSMGSEATLQKVGEIQARL